MATQGPSPALFFDTIGAYQRTEALRAAIELDLFSLVAAGRRTATELAEACRAAPRGVRILADYLTILGFLRTDGDGYELTDDAKMFLDRASPAYVGDAARFMLAPQLRESFQQLTAAVRRGGTAVSDEGTVSHDNPVWVEFARAMASPMHMPARLLAGLVGGDAGHPCECSTSPRGTGCSASRSPGVTPMPTSRRWTGRTCWRSRRRTRFGPAWPGVMPRGRAAPSTWNGAAPTTSCS
jgi:hypothetical protein